MAASGFPDRVAVQCGSETITYAELFAAAGGAATDVADSGRERMALLDVSSLAVPIGLFASGWCGRPYVPLNYRLSGAELDALLDRVEPAYLVTDSERAALLSARSGITVVDRDGFVGRCRSAGAREASWSMDGEDVAILLFTSGTTGAPKAAVLRHRHLVSYILGSVEFGSAAESDAALVSVPPYHIAGMAAILSSVYAGRRIVQLPDFSARRWLELVRTQAVTHAFVVPTMLARIVDAMEGGGEAACPGLRALSYGGGKMPQAVIERAMKLFPDAEFANAYGLTETSSTITLLGPDEHRTAIASEDPELRRRLISVGRPLPGVEIEIRDEEGEALGAGVSGEIYVRGEQVSGEYLGKGRGVDDDGWFATRDGGWMDPGGYLFVEGRIDDVIVRGGENLSPGEIEDTLLDHDAVLDCAVVGVADEQWGEAVVAVVVCRQGSAVGAGELKDWVRERLRSSRVPQRVEFRDELPYNETGKLLRRKLRQELAGEAS
ncbi:MAG: class I adenylate-forming enzyme family protein [Myxococcota bacterium]